MRVALISFEYPPAVAVGGIGTYAVHAARMLSQGGVDVEVFAAGPGGSTTCKESGVPVHRIPASDRSEFRERIVPQVVQRHSARKFDVFESPEAGAEGAGVAEALPDVARVVKLHTPTYLVARSGYEPASLVERARFSAGALRRGRIAFLKPPHYRRDADNEYLFAQTADEIAAPSQAIHSVVGADWLLSEDLISDCPLPFEAPESLCRLPVASHAEVVGFLGRLEPRKGVLELVSAIPSILKTAPHVRFRFIGPSWPFKATHMQQWIEAKLATFKHCLEFTGAITPSQLPEELAKCDIMVLPSRWESVGFVCAESLASGRAVIGSNSGGMAEMMVDGETGILIPPRNAAMIAEAVLSLVRRPSLVSKFGAAGRDSIVRQLAPQRILPLQMASYERAIARSLKRLASVDCLIGYKAVSNS